MDNIIEPNDTFDFSKLSLAHPTGLQGAAYFTKIEYNLKPLYIQTSKSLTKQGIVKTGKKYYCDLMFDKNSETLINWFENLENRCHKLIFEKSESWFDNSLEENDVENAFNSVIKVFKSGKCYLVRTNIKNNSAGLPAIKIYNEMQTPLTITDIKTETNIISILEIQGIKFTSRNFQIEIELKQIMVLDDEPVFDNCMIKTNKINEKKIENPNINIETTLVENKLQHFTNLDKDEDTDLEEYTKNNDFIEQSNSLGSSIINNLETIDTIVNINNTHDSIDISNNDISLDIDIEAVNLDDIIEDNNDLKEVDIKLNLDSLETLQLKKPNQVYFELYKEARNKAKIAKKNAILAYLEAKNIKKTYLIESINDSDSDFDAEIDDVSESELEGL